MILQTNVLHLRFSQPDSVLPPEQTTPMQRSATPNGSAVPQAPAAPATVSSSGGAAGALASWAMSSMAKRVRAYYLVWSGVTVRC